MNCVVWALICSGEGGMGANKVLRQCSAAVACLGLRGAGLLAFRGGFVFRGTPPGGRKTGVGRGRGLAERNQQAGKADFSIAQSNFFANNSFTCSLPAKISNSAGNLCLFPK